MLKRKQSKNNNEITAYGIGVVSSLLTILLLLCGSAICINNECLNIGDFKYMVILIQALGCCVGGIIAGAIGERNKKISVLVVSGVVVATQFVVGLLLLDGFPGGTASGAAVLYLCPDQTVSGVPVLQPVCGNHLLCIKTQQFQNCLPVCPQYYFDPSPCDGNQYAAYLLLLYCVCSHAADSLAASA